MILDPYCVPGIVYIRVSGLYVNVRIYVVQSFVFISVFTPFAFCLNGSSTGLSPRYSVFYRTVSSVLVMVLLLTTSSGLVLGILFTCFFGTYWHWIFD